MCVSVSICICIDTGVNVSICIRLSLLMRARHIGMSSRVKIRLLGMGSVTGRCVQGQPSQMPY